MRKKISAQISTWLACITSLAAAQGAPNAEGRPTAVRTVAVTINNPTSNQTFSRPIVVVHKGEAKLFAVGKAASPGLTELAEEGNASRFLAELAQNRKVVTTVVAPTTVRPGKSVTLTVELAEQEQISVFGKLLATNDGFFAAEGISGRGSEGSFAAAFDAGTEANTERCADIPSCGGINSRVTAGSEGVVAVHSGIRGTGDLAPAVYDFRDPTAEISVGPDRAGTFTMPMSLSIFDAPSEYILQEPSMCAGKANATISYSRARNTVVIDAEYEGVPTNLTTTFPVDYSTPYNRWPVTISNGAWQTWFVGYFGGRPTKIWYDARGRLIGTKYHLPNGRPPAGSFAVETKEAAIALCSPLWIPESDGHAHLRWEMKYDALQDSRATGGEVVVFTNYRYGDDNSYGRIDFGGLPVSDAMTFDEVLNSIRTRAGLAVATTYEPNPKPDYLASRPSTVSAWLGTYPLLIDPTPPVPCESHINPPFPGALLGF